MANNLNDIMKTLMSSDALKGIAKSSGIDVGDVSKVLGNVLPDLLNGANKQTTNKDTSSGFLTALQSHGSKDISDLSSFFKNVDLTDGGKIVGHLLGNNASSTATNAAKKFGIDEKAVSNIMSSAAPLMMSLLGKTTQSQKKDDNDLADIASSLLKNVDVGDILKKFIK